jgi:hypothetical protein
VEVITVFVVVLKTIIMAAEGGVIIIRFTYTGAVGENIPDEATHIAVAEDCTFVRTRAFYRHPNIVEVICHDKVKKIERSAFFLCPKLRRVVMPGVKKVEEEAFDNCRALEDVECGKLEVLKGWAFRECKSLRSINLPSARLVERCAFRDCYKLTDVKFGSNLERFEGWAFHECINLERITIPLKDGLITDDDTFLGCLVLKHVVLVEEELLNKSVAALQLEEWRNDMNEEIGSINQILPNVPAGWLYEEGYRQHGEKAQVIRSWIRSVLGKVEHYKAEHQRMLNEATTLLELAIWKANVDYTDESRIVREGGRTTRGSVKRARRELCITSGASIVIKNVLPFLQLKS